MRQAGGDRCARDGPQAGDAPALREVPGVPVIRRQVDQMKMMAEAHHDELAWRNLADGTELSFGAWHLGSNRLARGLLELGIAPCDRVAIAIGPDEPLAWLVTYAAVHKAGGVAVLVNPRLADREIARILEHAEPAVLVVGSAPEPAQGGTGGVNVPLHAWSTLADADESDVTPEGQGDVADMMYTSGTTGTPKAVVVPHGSPGDVGGAAGAIGGSPPPWHGLGFATSSPFWTTSGALLVYGPMTGGLSGWYLPRFDAYTWLAMVTEQRPVAAFLVPAMVQLLVSDPHFETADLSSLVAVTIGSAPIAIGTLHRLQSRLPNGEVLFGYGMTEFGAVSSVPSGDRGRHLGSVGLPLPGVEVRVVGDDGSDARAGHLGEIAVRGRGPRRRYAGEEASSSTSPSGWLYTGDLGFVDDDGFLWIAGRKKDLVIRGGNNVLPGEVEAGLFEHPDVVEAAVAGVPHPVLGEDVVAWVVPKDPPGLDAAELRAFLLERLADYKVPRRIILLGALPRNEAGKVIKSQLVSSARLADPTATAPVPTPPHEPTGFTR